MLVSRGPAFWSGWVMSALIHSAKKISKQRKWVRGCTNVKIGHERPKTLGWGVYTRVLLDRPEYKRHNGPLDFLFGQALFMGLLKNRLDQIAQVSKHQKTTQTSNRSCSGVLPRQTPMFGPCSWIRTHIDASTRCVGESSACISWPSLLVGVGDVSVDSLGKKD